MAQYVHLIHRDVDDNDNSSDSSDPVENDKKQEDKKQEHKQELLYVVFLVDESIQENIWDG